MLFQASTKHVVTVIARNRINGVSSLFYHDRILRFGKNMPQSLKGFLSNFNTVAIQNSHGGFCNTLNVRNNSKTSHWFPFIRSATSCNWFFFNFSLLSLGNLSNDGQEKKLWNWKGVYKFYMHLSVLKKKNYEKWTNKTHLFRLFSNFTYLEFGD